MRATEGKVVHTTTIDASPDLPPKGGSKNLNTVSQPGPIGYYVIVGRGVAATVNHTTLRQTQWGKRRLSDVKGAPLPVMHIAHEDPWRHYLAHEMGQFPNLLKLPGLELRPRPTGTENAKPGEEEDFGKPQKSDRFATRTAHEIARVEAAFKHTTIEACVVVVQPRTKFGAPLGPKLKERLESEEKLDKVLAALEVPYPPKYPPYRLLVAFPDCAAGLVYAHKIDVCSGVGRARMPGGDMFEPKTLLEKARWFMWDAPQFWRDEVTTRKVVSGTDGLFSETAWSATDRIVVMGSGGVAVNMVERAEIVHGVWVDWLANKTLHASWVNPRNDPLLKHPGGARMAINEFSDRENTKTKLVPAERVWRFARGSGVKKVRATTAPTGDSGTRPVLKVEIESSKPKAQKALEDSEKAADKAKLDLVKADFEAAWAEVDMLVADLRADEARRARAEAARLRLDQARAAVGAALERLKATVAKDDLAKTNAEIDGLLFELKEITTGVKAERLEELASGIQDTQIVARQQLAKATARVESLKKAPDDVKAKKRELDSTPDPGITNTWEEDQALVGDQYPYTPKALGELGEPAKTDTPSQYDRVIFCLGQDPAGLGQPEHVLSLVTLESFTATPESILIGLESSDKAVRVLGIAGSVNAAWVGTEAGYKALKDYEATVPVPAIPDGFALNSLKVAIANHYFDDAPHANVNTMTRKQLLTKVDATVAGAIIYIRRALVPGVESIAALSRQLALLKAASAKTVGWELGADPKDVETVKLVQKGLAKVTDKGAALTEEWKGMTVPSDLASKLEVDYRPADPFVT